MHCSRCQMEWCWLCDREWNRECQGNHWFGWLSWCEKLLYHETDDERHSLICMRIIRLFFLSVYSCMNSIVMRRIVAGLYDFLSLCTTVCLSNSSFCIRLKICMGFGNLPWSWVHINLQLYTHVWCDLYTIYAKYGPVTVPEHGYVIVREGEWVLWTDYLVTKCFRYLIKVLSFKYHLRECMTICMLFVVINSFLKCLSIRIL